MESNSWADDNRTEDTASDKSTGDDRFARPSNFVFGPGRSAVWGSAESIKTSAESEFPPLFARPERSEPETARAVIPAEVDLPAPAEAPAPVRMAPEATAYHAAVQEAAWQAAEQKEDEDDDEDTDDDDDLSVTSPAVAETETAAPDQIEGEITLRPAAEMPPQPEAPAPLAVPATEAFQYGPEPLEPAPHPLTPPPEFIPPKPVAPLEDASSQPAWRTASGAGGALPPPPPPPQEFGSASPEPPEPERSWSPASADHRNPFDTEPVPKYSPNTYVTHAEADHTYRTTRKEIAGAFLTTAAIGWWLHRQSKKRDKALAEQLKDTQQTLRHMSAAHEDYRTQTSTENLGLRRNLAEQQERLEALPGALPSIQKRQETASTPPPPVAERLLGTPPPEQPVELLPQEQLRHSAWHSYVEKDGHVVDNAIRYGEAFQQEQQRERNPVAFSAQDNRFAAGATTNYYGTTPEPTLPSGQMPANYSLPSGQPTRQDPQHLLPEPEPHPLVATVMSPWLWLGVGILLIAFFLAATI